MRRSKITELAINRKITGGGSSGGSGGTDERFKQLVEGTLTEVNDSEITSIAQKGCFYYNKIVNAVNLPKVTEAKTSAFAYSSIKTAHLPLLKRVESEVFKSCTLLEEVYLPSATFVGYGTFEDCIEIEQIDFPKMEQINQKAFSSCRSLKCLILRNEEKMCSLTAAASSIFSSCYHFFGTVNATYNPEGKKDGYYYVPRKWLSDEDETMDYRRATNWTTFSTQFRALEDYTVDGTTTGELDWEKVNAA